EVSHGMHYLEPVKRKEYAEQAAGATQAGRSAGYARCLPLWQYRYRQSADAVQLFMIITNADVPHMRGAADMQRFGDSMHIPSPYAAHMVGIDLQSHTDLLCRIDDQCGRHATHGFRQRRG